MIEEACGVQGGRPHAHLSSLLPCALELSPWFPAAGGSGSVACMQPPPPWPPGARPLPSMGQQSVASMMQQQQQQQPGGGGRSGGAGAGRSKYTQKALEEIRNSLLPFANSEPTSSGASTISLLSSTSGVSSSASNCSNGIDSQQLASLLTGGYHEEMSVRGLKTPGGRLESAMELLMKQQQQQGEPGNGLCKSSSGMHNQIE
ncbi:hypothetical protein B566_EDAN004019 [Ephemera danica]|nr:hypothetical protein B566_EDAN004019 [Ephemera danica]